MWPKLVSRPENAYAKNDAAQVTRTGSAPAQAAEQTENDVFQRRDFPAKKAHTFLSDITRARFGRFLLTGGLNSVLSYGIYLALTLVLPYAVAYTIAYVAGIGISYVLQTAFVFQVRRSVRTFCTFPLVYAVQYGASVGLLELLVTCAGVSVPVAPLVVMALITPLTFVVSRFVLTRQAK